VQVPDDVTSGIARKPQSLQQPIPFRYKSCGPATPAMLITARRQHMMHATAVIRSGRPSPAANDPEVWIGAEV